jgi:hypothetical protein
VEDDWHENYNGAPSDGSAWIDDPRGSFRVIRGGPWDGSARSCRAAFRFRNEPGRRCDVLGFRLALFPGQQLSSRQGGRANLSRMEGRAVAGPESDEIRSAASIGKMVIKLLEIFRKK